MAEISPGEIIALLQPIWRHKEETARRVLQRIDAVFVSAINGILDPALLPGRVGIAEVSFDAERVLKAPVERELGAVVGRK